MSKSSNSEARNSSPMKIQALLRSHFALNALIWMGGIAAVVAGSALAIRFLGDSSWFGVVGVVIGIAFLVVVFVIPAHWLPAVAVGAFAFVPIRFVPDNPLLSALPLPAIVMVVWMIRRGMLALSARHSGHTMPFGRIRPHQIIVGAILVWLLLSLLFSDFKYTASGWTISFTAAALLPLLVRNAAREAEVLRSFMVVSGGIAGTYAIVEGLFRYNFVFTPIYNAMGLSSVQHWSVYRSEITFGHPLWAATFLSIGAAYGIIRWLTDGSKRDLIFGLLAALGVVATVSRGAVLALGLALLTGILCWAFSRVGKSVGRTLLLGIGGVAGIFAVIQFSGLLERGGSTEAIQSNMARDRAWTLSMDAAARHWPLGSGPGTSSLATAVVDDKTVIENSGLQFLVSTGGIGLALVLVLIAAAGIASMLRRDYASLAALVAYVVAVAGYNAIDAKRSMHVLFFCVIAMAMYGANNRDQSSGDTDVSFDDRRIPERLSVGKS